MKNLIIIASLIVAFSSPSIAEKAKPIIGVSFIGMDQIYHYGKYGYYPVYAQHLNAIFGTRKKVKNLEISGYFGAGGTINQYLNVGKNFSLSEEMAYAISSRMSFGLMSKQSLISFNSHRENNPELTNNHRLFLLYVGPTVRFNIWKSGIRTGGLYSIGQKNIGFVLELEFTL